MGRNKNCNCNCTSKNWNIEKRDADDGQIIWRKSIPSNASFDAAASCWEPKALSDGSIVVSSNAGLVRVDPDGKVMKTIETGLPASQSGQTPTTEPATVVKASGGSADIPDMIIVSNGGITAYDSQFEVIWQNLSVGGPIALYDDKIWTQAGEFITTLNPASGAISDFNHVRMGAKAGPLPPFNSFVFVPGASGLQFVSGDGIVCQGMRFPLTPQDCTSFGGPSQAFIDTDSGNPAEYNIGADAGGGFAYFHIASQNKIGLVKLVGSGHGFFVDSWASTGYLGDNSFTSGTFHSGNATVTSIQAVSGGVLVSGYNGWVDDEYVNIWKLDGSGDIIWAASQVHEQRVPHDSLYGATTKMGQCVCKADGNYIFTNQLHPFRQPWRTKQTIISTSSGSFTTT